MHTRKIQLIANSTFSVSLPKEWVIRNKLNAGSEITFSELKDMKLLLSPRAFEEKKIHEMTINIDDYEKSIDQIMFAIYYMGVESISLFSKSGIKKETSSRIRKAIRYMSGAEISHEDKNKFTIKILLDKSRVDIIQTVYRISLIIENSISNLQEKIEIEEMKQNEDEIDRLYHLISKMVTLSLADSNILRSSGINNILLVPSFFLMSKKLENIADNLYHIAVHLNKEGEQASENKKLLEFFKTEISRSITSILGKQKGIFQTLSKEEIKSKSERISEIKDKLISNYYEDILRYVIDIEEELVIMSFYNQIIKGKEI